MIVISKARVDTSLRRAEIDDRAEYGGQKMSVASVSGKPCSAVARLLQRKLAVVGLGLILVVVSGAVFAPLLVGYAPDQQLFDGLTLEGAPLPPGGAFLLGTDLLGRDLWARILYGARTSLVIGLVANGIALAIGTAVGVTRAISAVGSGPH